MALVTVLWMAYSMLLQTVMVCKVRRTYRIARLLRDHLYSDKGSPYYGEHINDVSGIFETEESVRVVDVFAKIACGVCA